MSKMSMPIAYAMKKKAQKMAYGGKPKGVHEETYASRVSNKGESYAGHLIRESKEAESMNNNNENERAVSGPLEEAKHEHRLKLKELRSMKKPELMAEGGEVQDPFVMKIMMGRANGYSKGGMVANGGEADLGDMADGMPNDFDDLSLDGDIQGHNEGSEEIGDDQEDMDRHDIVKRIMKSRGKKDRLPSPA